MKNYSIGTRYISLLLLVALFFSFVPSLGLYAKAAQTAAYDEMTYITAAEDGITMLNNGNSISLPIKINNFVNDGLLFEYLGSLANEEPNANDYTWEFSKNDGNAFVQLFSYYLLNRAGQPGLDGDNNGISNRIKLDGSLDNDSSTKGDDTGRTSAGTTINRNLVTQYYDNNDSTYASGDFPFLRLRAAAANKKERAWTKLTTFDKIYGIRDVRYAVVVYKSPNSDHLYKDYDDFYLTVNTQDDTGSNKSQVVKRIKRAGGGDKWQFAVIDLLGGNASGTTRVTSVYLHTFLSNYDADGKVDSDGPSAARMDIAAVGYFPYYGDAEQFGYYGVSMGCDPKYAANAYNNHNAFAFRYDARAYGADNFPIIGANEGVKVNASNVSTATNTIGYQLFGMINGGSVIGMMEPALVNGRPVYKAAVVDYVAQLMRWALTDVPEYPTNGWRNPSFVSGSSTSGGSCEAVFDKDEYGYPMDLGTALCKEINNCTKGSGTLNGDFGSIEETKAKADKLIGSWMDCRDEIDTWTDAAYYLLHNLYVTDTEVADPEVDGYGEYEDDYQYLVLPQVKWDNDGTASTAAVDSYFFDAGYAHLGTFNRDTDHIDVDDMKTSHFTSALTFDKNKHTITMDGDADVKALAYSSRAGSTISTFGSIFPFLPTSGTGTNSGESNIPYWHESSVLKRSTVSRTYQTNDFHFSMTGNGYFYYEPGLYFNFEGDDDVFLYINGQIVVDVGGAHSATQYNMELDDYVDWAWGIKNDATKYDALSDADKARVDALALETGKRYPFDFFYMERHGTGSNLRILTNMEVGESGLDVDKFAYQDGKEIADNGLFDIAKKVEYGFSITNNSEEKLYNLVFEDELLGISMDSTSGLVVKNGVTNAYGTKLTANTLSITVEGIDANGEKIEPFSISCANNEELKNFLRKLDSDDGTDVDVSMPVPENESAEEKFLRVHSGDGLWVDATVTVRGIFTMVETTNKFTNTVNASGIGNGTVVTGFAKHTLYNVENMVDYYQWAGKPIVITRDKLRADLIEADIAKEGDLPDAGNMVLLPQSENVSSEPGGTVYLKVNYDTVGAYVTYITILDRADEEFSMTVPIVVYALNGQDSVVVLDYGLDTDLTENNVIFDFGAAAGKVDGKVLGITEDGSSTEYIEFVGGMFNANHEANYVGTADNDLTLLAGGANANGAHTGSAHYGIDTTIQLKHNKPWVIEWYGIVPDGGDMLFSLHADGNAEDNMYFQIRNLNDEASTPDRRYLGFGYHPKTSWGGSEALRNITLGLGGEGGVKTGVADEKVLSGANLEVHNALENITDKQHFELRNAMNTDGTNSIHLFINGDWIGELNQYFAGDVNHTNDTTTVAKTHQNWFTGRDFTFNYIGVESGNASDPLNGTYDYIHVYENGKQFRNFKWEMTAKEGGGYEFIPTHSNQNGYFEAKIEMTTGKIDQTNGKLYTAPNADKIERGTCWELDTRMILNHDNPWAISFTAAIKGGTTIVMSQSNNLNKNGHAHLIVYPDKHMVGIGIRNYVSGGSDNHFVVYGVEIDQSIDLTKEHTYLLKNELNSDGTNMVYLYLDDVKVGALDSLYKNTTLLSETSHALSGRDLIFTYIGHYNKDYGFRSGSTLKSMSVCYNTGMDTAYEWKFNSSIKRLESINGIKENGVNNGNQITFVADKDGVISFKDGDFTYSYTLNNSTGTLMFEMNNFLEKGYSIEAAIAIYEKNFTPSTLAGDIDIGNEAQMIKKVTVLPASVVYYEDDFPAIHYVGSDKTESGFTILTDNTEYIVEGSGSLSLEQNPDQDTPYGSDPSYAGDDGDYSGQSLHKIAINNDGPLAWFSFTGTGFEISSRTNAYDSGMLLVEVYKNSQVVRNANGEITFDAKGNVVLVSGGSRLKLIPVISEFDNMAGVDDGVEGGSDEIYQVPLVRYNTATKDEYLVVIKGVEMLDFSNNMEHKDSYLYLDGIRIYQPSDGDDDLSYGNEINTSFEEVRNLILNGKMLVCDFDGSVSGGQFSVGTATTTWTEKRNSLNYKKEEYEGNIVNSVNDYLMEGPNNEVYMVGGTDIVMETTHNGALAFYVSETSARSGGLLHLGVRAIDMGLFYGQGSTGLNAKLELGIATANGLGWYDLATIATGTEQYINIPYGMCPIVSVNGTKCYQVVIRVPAESNTNAMVSFSGLKTTNGLTLGAPNLPKADMTLVPGASDVGTAAAYELLSGARMQMAANGSATLAEIEAGSEFIMNALNDENQGATVEKFELAGANTVLGGVLDMNFFINPADLNGTDYYAEITLYTEDGVETTTVPYADWEVRTNYLVVTQKGLAARQMADKIEVVIYNGDGTQGSEVWTDSIRSYVMRILEKQDGETKTMLVDMLNYGAAAQNFFGYNTDDLANNQLSDAQKAYATETATCTNQQIKGENYNGSTLVLVDRILLTMYFDNIDSNMYAIVSFTDHKGAAHETRIEGSEFAMFSSTTYGVTVDELVVADGEQLVTVTVYDAEGNVVASGSDSVNSYAARQMGQDALYEMVAKFTTSAYAYLH